MSEMIVQPVDNELVSNQEKARLLDMLNNCRDLESFAAIDDYLSQTIEDVFGHGDSDEFETKRFLEASSLRLMMAKCSNIGVLNHKQAVEFVGNRALNLQLGHGLAEQYVQATDKLSDQDYWLLETAAELNEMINATDDEWGRIALVGTTIAGAKKITSESDANQLAAQATLTICESYQKQGSLELAEIDVFFSKLLTESIVVDVTEKQGIADE